MITFPNHLNIVFGFLALFIAITAQFIFIKRRIKRQKTTSSQARTPEEIAGLIRAVRLATSRSEKTPPNTAKQTENISSQEKIVIKEANISAARSSSSENVLRFSAQAQKAYQGKSQYTSPKQPLPPIRSGKSSIFQIEDSEISLFDDIQEELGTENKKQETRNKEKTSSSATKKKENKTKETPKAVKPPFAQEFLTSDDFQASKEDNYKDSQAVLNKLKTLYQNKKWHDGLKSIKRWFQMLDANHSITELEWEIIYLKGKIEFQIGRIAESVSSFQLLFKTYLSNKNTQFLTLLEKVIALFSKSNQFQHALPFLFLSLNEYRMLNDRKKMDQRYLDIEKAYEQKKDWKKLIQTYQNHLAIKKVIKDYDGQLHLLDMLGKLYYDQGDKAGSNQCYEKSIQLKKEMLDTQTP